MPGAHEPVHDSSFHCAMQARARTHETWLPPEVMDLSATPRACNSPRAALRLPTGLRCAPTRPRRCASLSSVSAADCRSDEVHLPVCVCSYGHSDCTTIRTTPAPHRAIPPCVCGPIVTSAMLPSQLLADPGTHYVSLRVRCRPSFLAGPGAHYACTCVMFLSHVERRDVVHCNWIFMQVFPFSFSHINLSTLWLKIVCFSFTVLF